MSSDTNIGRLARAGFGWLAAGRIATQAIGLVNSIVLARLLIPDDFGLVAMALAVGGVARAIGDFGVSAIVVQREELSQEFIDAAYTLNVTLFLAIGLCQFVLAPVGAYLMEEPRLVSVMIGLALILPFNGIDSFHRSLLRRELRFSRLVALNLLKAVTLTISACALAFSGFGVWSLVIGMAVSGIASAVASRGLSGIRPRASLAAAREYREEIIQFGKYATGNSIINYLVHNADYLLVGRLLSTTDLGLYSFAYERSRLVNAPMLQIVGAVSFPALSRLKSDMSRLREAYLKLTLGGFAITAPATVFLAAYAEEVIPLVFGDQWWPAVRAFQILSIHVIFNAATSGGGNVIYAVGRPDVAFKVMRWTVVPLVVAYYVGAKVGGIDGVAVAVVVVKSATSCLFIWSVFRHVGWRAWPLTRPLVLMVSGALLAAIVSRFASNHLYSAQQWQALAIATPIFVLVYSLFQLLANRSAVSLVWQGLLGDAGFAWCRTWIPVAIRRMLAIPA